MLTAFRRCPSLLRPHNASSIYTLTKKPARERTTFRLARIKNLRPGYSLDDVMQTYHPNVAGPINRVVVLKTSIILHYYSDLFAQEFEKFHSTVRTRPGIVEIGVGKPLEAADVSRMGLRRVGRELQVRSRLDHPSLLELAEEFGPVEHARFDADIFRVRFLDERDATEFSHAVHDNSLPEVQPVTEGLKHAFVFPSEGKLQRYAKPGHLDVVLGKVKRNVSTKTFTRKVYDLVKNDATLKMRAELFSDIRRVVGGKDGWDALHLKFLEPNFAPTLCHSKPFVHAEAKVQWGLVSSPDLGLQLAAKSGATRTLRINRSSLPSREVIERDMRSFGDCDVSAYTGHTRYTTGFVAIQFYRLVDALTAMVNLCEGLHELEDRYTYGIISFLSNGCPKQHTEPSVIVDSNQYVTP